MKLLSKSLLAVVTISTASAYYAQSSDSLKGEKNIEEVVITGVADIAKDRKTPVAVSTIKEAENKEISIADAVADVKKEFEAMLKLVKEVKETADSENDYGTSAMVDEYISTYEKDLWMLNAYLK